MKRFLLVFLFPLALLAQDPDDQVFRIQNDPPPFYPFSLTGSYIDVGKTNFRTSGFKDKDLKYRQWEAALAYTHPLTPYCGLIFGAGWTGSEVDMEDNPDFNETIFNYINLSIGAFTKAFPSWTWTATVAAYLDTEEFSLMDYTIYQGVLWGKYEFCKGLELDFGLVAQVGLNKDKVWPILGFVYIPSEKWQINAVYPIDISINYFFNSCWTASGSFRLFYNYHRVKDTEPNPQGIFEYRTTGLEFDLAYSPFVWFSIKGFAGSTMDGDLKISDRNNNNSTHYKFNGSFYAGTSAYLSF